MNTKDQSMTKVPQSLTFGSVFAITKAPHWLAALGLLLATAMPAMAQCPLSFAAVANYAAGTQPRSVAVGDFNADGRPDLAVALAGSGGGGNLRNVSILLGNANGAFQAAVNHGAGTWPSSVAAGDFNADGRPDLAVANQTSNSVSILLGNANGTFQARVNHDTRSGPISVAVGDFNADGRPDLAVANSYSRNVSILLGNPPPNVGTFQRAVVYAVGSVPRSVAVGDFNADGQPDLAVANGSSNNVSILLGNANGTFLPAVNYAAGFTPYSVAVGDFNSDGRPDLAVANHDGDNVSILLGNGGGGGTFQARVNYAVGSRPVSIAVGDFNADGRPDLAVANISSNTVSILLGNGGGGGTFQARINYAVRSGPISVAVGDFNADGRPDLVVANHDSDNVAVLLNTTPSPVISQQPASVSTCPYGTATFSITATGTGPFTYQWQWQPAGPTTAWAALSDGINNNTQGTPAFDVSGATTPTMNISSISGLGGNFRCLITNFCGSVTSNEATLTICRCLDCPADFNQDSGVDGSDVGDFFAVWQGGGCDGDVNADGGVDGSDVDTFFTAWVAGGC